jgi:DNA-directed RNA polymerase subunit K/omega
MVDVIDTGETESINYDQIAISKEFDRIPKPTFMAMKEIYEGKLSYELPKPEAAENIVK